MRDFRRIGLKKAVCKVEEMHNALALITNSQTNGKGVLLELFREALSNSCIVELRSKIDMILDDAAAGGSGSGAAQVQRCFAVRAGRDALLDVARQTFNDNHDDINQLIQQYRDEFGIGCVPSLPFLLCPFSSFLFQLAIPCPSLLALSIIPLRFVECAQTSFLVPLPPRSLKIAFSASRGYHVSAKCDADALPPNFIQV